LEPGEKQLLEVPFTGDTSPLKLAVWQAGSVGTKPLGYTLASNKVRNSV
jgi:hypothetical protein